MTAPTEPQTPALIASLLRFCHAHPEHSPFAQSRLSEILSPFKRMTGSPSVPKNQVRREIEEHLAGLQPHKVIHLHSVDYRSYARVLSKKHEIPSQATELKKKDDIMIWLSDHWETVKVDFFMLVDGAKVNA
jgi:hypothetical protein